MSETHSLYHYLSFQDKTPYRRYVQVKSTTQQGKTITPKPSAATHQAHGSYGALLLHPKWKSKRKEILIRDKYQCVHCRQTNDLQVHHRQYHFLVSRQTFRLPWDYPDHLLITLCNTCNRMGHSKYKVPTINI